MLGLGCGAVAVWLWVHGPAVWSCIRVPLIAASLPHPPNHRRGFSGWGMTGTPAAWLARLEQRYSQAQEHEEQELEGQEGPSECCRGCA